jgi:CelD/BcsL family acetyltransferase involved in cellulose biosynthesis
LRIVPHRGISESPELLRRWNAVALQMEQPQVFYTAEWALAMQSAYRASLKPLLLLGYEEEKLVGIASLASDPAGKTNCFLAATTADYFDFISAPEVRVEFLDAVFADLNNRKLKQMTLANIPADSKTSDALREVAGRHGFHVFIRPAYLCAHVELGAGQGRAQLKNSLLGKKKLRRYLREMEREGPVTFVHLQTDGEIRKALPAFADAHVARFLATSRTSSLSTPERRLFLEELARRFDGAGVVTLSVLKIGDKAVAWNYGFQFHGSWFWYQPTFDSQYEENSPGHCLLSRIVVEACDLEGMQKVDLGLGAEGYKERFGNGNRQTLHATVTRSFVGYLREILRYRAATALKRSPRLESAVRSLRGGNRQSNI